MLIIKMAGSIYTPGWMRSKIGLSHVFLPVTTLSVANQYSTE
jgi:hypothetical protein